MNNDSHARCFQERVFGAWRPCCCWSGGVRSRLHHRDAHVSPGGFVPTTLEIRASAPPISNSASRHLCCCMLLLSAASILFTVKDIDESLRLDSSRSLIATSFLIEIFNNLPLVAVGIYQVACKHLCDVLLYLRQVETISTCPRCSRVYPAYVADSFMRLSILDASVAILYGDWSIVLFIANIPCLWFAQAWQCFDGNVHIRPCACSIFLARNGYE